MPPTDTDERRLRFESLTLPLMQVLYASARRLAGDPEDAADLLQETYLRAYRTFDNFRLGTNCKAWLFTILYSVFFNRRKQRQREVGPLPPDVLEQRFNAYIEAPAGPEDELDNAPEPGLRWSRDVEAALGALPDAFRAAVLLVDVEELSYEDAATALGCPVGTLRSRLFRGRRLLFAALHDYARRTGYRGRMDP